MVHHDLLRVYETGPVTVVGLGANAWPEDFDLAGCRDEIVELLSLHDCKELVFDLTGVRYIPSSMLGMLASLHREGVQVNLYNPSGEVREVLAITHLDRLFKVHSRVA